MYYTLLFWFHRLVALRKHIGDAAAGLEQQAYQVLERHPVNVDWSVVEQILSAAERIPERASGA